MPAQFALTEWKKKKKSDNETEQGNGCKNVVKESLVTLTEMVTLLLIETPSLLLGNYKSDFSKSKDFKMKNPAPEHACSCSAS